MTLVEKPQPTFDVQPLSEGKPKPPKERSYWIDNLRMLSILLVVNMHACVTYSHVGGWYYMSPKEPSLLEKLPIALWQGHLQSFFMGLLFFLAGYYSDRSLAKKGPAGFLKDRAFRLGLPTLFYMLVIDPLMVWGFLIPAAERPAFLDFYQHFVLSGKFLSASGPMWFAFALLLFSIPFAFLAKPKNESERGLTLAPATLWKLGVGMAIGSFLVRLVYPIGTDFMNFQPCFFTQYVVVFLLGSLVSRRDALEQIAKSNLARKAGILALILGPLALIAVTVLGGPIPEKAAPPMFGGWHWQALAMALWEQCTGVGLGLGALALCYRKFNLGGKAWKWLSDRSFGVYLLHPPILIALAIAMKSLNLGVIPMALVLTATGWSLANVAASIAKKTPLLRALV